MGKGKRPAATTTLANFKSKSQLASSSGSSEATLGSPSQSTPNWPTLRLASSSSSPERFDLYAPPLNLEPLLPGQVLIARNFFPKSLCREYVAFLKTLPLTTTPGKPKKGEAARVNDRFQVEDTAFARHLWEETKLKELISGYGQSGEEDGQLHQTAEGRRKRHQIDMWGGEILGLNPNIRVYRYGPGQFFDQHYDDSNNLTLHGTADGPTAVAAKTTWTLLLYLTSAADGECEGGETVFYPDGPAARGFKKGGKGGGSDPELAVVPETGMLLLHKHGEDCLLHEGREVRSGEKWILRTDLCVKR